ncbi:hypothetical protein Clacol_000559 [Clathrus columnatus]|uniref:Uncharacterized protein n=1 Tax=Clathrus columnatus TaxID=1419009 RepID=A0AAV4ZZL6_9AGAM|nr:hypothetical protein Clacol_000559 [Clathrus columnatus]
MSVDIEERELPVIQRGLVDTCFEEAQYESGIDVLYGLRSFRYKPPPLHIRQLIYIALLPPPLKQTLDTKELPDAPPSPQKICLQKDDIWPKPIARQKALALLRSYVGINSPQSLMRAFPFYPYVSEDGTNDGSLFGNERLEERFHEDNTPLREEIVKFQFLKDCWGCLKERFAKRNQQDSALGSRKQNILDSGTIEQQAGFVGPYAWPILEWLISVFEKDEELQQLNGESGRGPRIGLDVPVEILKECFLPPSLDSIVSNSNMDFSYTTAEKRQELGARFLSLTENLDVFFSSLSLDQAVFKLNILEHLMIKNEERTTAPRARARAKPRAKGADPPKLDIHLVEGAYIVPPLDRFITLVSSLSSSDGQDAALMKYHLVSALFQARDGVSLIAYDEAVKTGVLQKSIEEGFEETKGVASTYKRIALNIVQAWEKQI